MKNKKHNRKKKFIIHLMFWLLLIVLLPSALSVPLTTFGGGSNPSTDCDDWDGGNFLAGKPSFLTTPCIGFNDTNYFVNVTRGDAGTWSGAFSISADNLNYTYLGGVSGGATDILQIISGKLAPYVQVGQCMDIPYLRTLQTSSPTMFIGMDSNLDRGTTPSRIMTSNADAWGIGGGNYGYAFFHNGNTAIQAMGHAQITQVYENITICFNASTLTTVYWNNSDIGVFAYSSAAGTGSGNLSFGYEFGGAAGTSDVLSIGYYALYNMTTGAPQVVVLDTSAPTSDSTALNNTSPKINEVVNPSAKFTDETSLSSIWASHNQSGLFANFSSTNFTGTVLTGNFSPNLTITLGRSNVIGFKFTANDTSGNSVQSSIFTLTVANTAPSFSGSSISQTAPNTTTTLTGTTSGYSDADSDAESGSTYKWYKNTAVIGGQTTTSLAGSNFVKSDVIIFEATPSDGTNSGSPVNSSSVTIVNTPPTATSIGNASDNNFNRNLTLGATASTDDDSDAIYYAIYFDNVNPPLVLVQNTTATTFTTNMTTETVYFAKVDVMDGTDKSSGTTIFNLTLDTSTPSWQSSLISNGTFYRVSTNITYNCTDTNIFEVNTTIYNRNGVTQRNSIGYLNLTPSSGGSKTINLTIDTALGDGEYNATRWCGDTKNKDRAFSTASHSVTGDNQTITFNDTASNTQLNISFGTENPSGIFVPANSNIGLQTTVQDVGSLNTGVYPDYFKFATSVLLPNTQFTLSIKFVSNQKIQTVSDLFANHLLIGSGKEKISIHADDLRNAGFDVTTWSEGTAYYWRVEKGNNTYTNGQRVLFDPTIDNLNIIENSAIYTVDTAIPTINNITFTNFANNSFVSRSLINITYNVSDTYNSSILFYVNGVKNATFGYISNTSQIATIPITIEGNYSILFEANDSANNKLNSSFIYVAIDTTEPSVNNQSNRTSDGSFTTSSTINLSVIAGDIYGSTINIQFNISTGVLNTTSLTWAGNTTYSLLVATGLVDGQVIGWNSTSTDLAGNTYSTTTSIFTITNPPQQGSGSGGASIYTSGAEAGTQVFSSQRSSDPCLSGFTYFEGKCYTCAGELSKKSDGSIICTKCKAGFEKKENKCVAKPSKLPYQDSFNSMVDNWSAKISPNNPMLGFLIIIASVGLIGTFIYNDSLRRKQNGSE